MKLRGLAAFAAMVALPALLVIACRPKELNLGADDGDDADVSPTTVDGGDETTTTTTTLEEKLRARCNAPHGGHDRVASVKELYDKLTSTGRWFQCNDESTSPFFNFGIELTSTREWHRLVWADATHNELDRATEPDDHGIITCKAYVYPDAGAGLDAGANKDSGATGTIDVSCDDPTSRNEAQILLLMEPDGSGQPHVLSIDFEKDPTRAFASENDSSDIAELVPAD